MRKNLKKGAVTTGWVIGLIVGPFLFLFSVGWAANKIGGWFAADLAAADDCCCGQGHLSHYDWECSNPGYTASPQIYPVTEEPTGSTTTSGYVWVPPTYTRPSNPLSHYAFNVTCTSDGWYASTESPIWWYYTASPAIKHPYESIWGTWVPPGSTTYTASSPKRLPTATDATASNPSVPSAPRAGDATDGWVWTITEDDGPRTYREVEFKVHLRWVLAGNTYDYERTYTHTCIPAGPENVTICRAIGDIVEVGWTAPTVHPADGPVTGWIIDTLDYDPVPTTPAASQAARIVTLSHGYPHPDPWNPTDRRDTDDLDPPWPWGDVVRFLSIPESTGTVRVFAYTYLRRLGPPVEHRYAGRYKGTDLSYRTVPATAEEFCGTAPAPTVAPPNTPTVTCTTNGFAASWAPVWPPANAPDGYRYQATQQAQYRFGATGAWTARPSAASGSGLAAIGPANPGGKVTVRVRTAGEQKWHQHRQGTRV